MHLGYKNGTQPPGPIMVYHGFHIFVSKHLRSAFAQANLPRFYFQMRSSLRQGTRVKSILWPPIKETYSPSALQLCFLIYLCSGIHWPVLGITSFILKDGVKSYNVHGSAVFWLPLCRWRKVFYLFCILCVLYTEQTRASEVFALSPIVLEDSLAVTCLSRCCIFRRQNHKFESCCFFPTNAACL